MHRPERLVITLVTAVLAIAAAACHKSPAVAKSYPDTAAGFDQFAKDLVATVKDGRKADFETIARTLAPPDPKGWFTTTFGAETGDRLLAEYTSSPFSRFDNAYDDLRHLIVDEHRTTLTTSRHDNPDDEMATGHQANALRAMKQPVALYGIQITRPDGEKSFTLVSFVSIDGKFRLVGKLKTAQVSAPSDDPEVEKMVDMLGDLPIKEARALMQKQRTE